MNSGVFVHGTGLLTIDGRGEEALSWNENAASRHRGEICTVDPTVLADVERIPRLRRSGMISLLAVAAAMDAVREMDPRDRGNLPVFFATTDGGVRHTARFYEEIMLRGTGAGSPLLFPETVYNAPASHISAALGSTHESSAFVGDAGAAFTALAAASEALEAGLCEFALVVAAQEADPVALAAYRALKVLGGRESPPLAEAAAAVLLGTPFSPCRLAAVREGRPFRTAAEAALHLQALLHDMTLPQKISWVPSASGTALATAESTACTPFGPQSPNFRLSTGEAMAASALAGLAFATHWLASTENPRSFLLPCLGIQGSCCAALLTTTHATT
jgi:hypothetical protein